MSHIKRTDILKVTVMLQNKFTLSTLGENKILDLQQQIKYVKTILFRFERLLYFSRKTNKTNVKIQLSQN